MPELIIIAGCNGAGKSTFASSFLPEGLTSFDYDRLYLENYNSIQESEYRDVFAKKKTSEEFDKAIDKAIKNNLDFCFETNFDVYHLHWAEIFRKHKYKINLIFFCIENQEIARHRVSVRTEFKGHFVDNATIDLKWKAGYKNINEHFSFFDNILFVDNSKQNEVYTNILQIEEKSVVIMTDEIPNYFAHRLPNIFEYIKNT